MKVTVFGATGGVGSELAGQAVAAGHDVTVLVRNAGKCDPAWRDKVKVVEGSVLEPESVAMAIDAHCDAVLFAIGVVKDSPAMLCADATRVILDVMKQRGVERFVFCGGGSNLLPEDQVTFGARFVRFFSETFMAKKHQDKEAQLALLAEEKSIRWSGIRPLQIKQGPKTDEYRLGYDSFSGMSQISFADVAHAMLDMMNSDSWIHQVPIIQY